MPTLYAKITELEQCRAKCARLELELAMDLHISPAKFNQQQYEKPALSPNRATKPVKPKRKKWSHRAIITAATREQVRNLTEAGRSGREIAAKLNISESSVTVIRGQLRKKK